MDGYITIGTELDTKSFDKQIASLEVKLKHLEEDREILASQKTISESDLELLKQYDSEIEKTSNQIVGLRQKQNDLVKQDVFSGINFQLDGIIKKVAKWGLALFGIRSIYSAIRQSMSTLSQQDSNLASQIEYIRWAVANAIAPVVKFIINGVYLILQYVNQITRALFGWDLFKGPKEFSKSMKKASGSAKEIKKSLAGFDEMNILGNNTTASGGGGVATPSFDTDSVIESINKIKNKFKELSKNWRDETEAMGKALENPKAFREAYGNWDWLMMGITRMGYGINNVILGFSDVFAGTFKVIKGIVTGDGKLVEEGFAQIGEGIKEIIWGVLNIIWGWILTKLGLLKGLLLSFLDWLRTNFTKILTKALGPIGVSIADAIFTPLDMLKARFASIGDGIIQVFKGVKKFFKGDFKGGITDVFSGLKDILLAPFRGMREGINKIIKGLNKIKLPGVLGGGKISIPEIPKFAKGTIINNPGRGVPIGIGGEAGREAILPLSDSRLLEELGSTIGRYITINLTNETKLDGRTIARKVSQLNTSENFLRNR